MSQTTTTEARRAGDQPRRRQLGRIGTIIAVPVLSVVLAFIVGAIIIWLSGLVSNGSIDLTLPFVAYGALLQGAFGSVDGILTTILDASTLVLVSEAGAPGPRFRLTYRWPARDRLELSFEIAPPGGAGEFKPYIQARLHRSP